MNEQDILNFLKQKVAEKEAEERLTENIEKLIVRIQNACIVMLGKEARLIKFEVNDNTCKINLSAKTDEEFRDNFYFVAALAEKVLGCEFMSEEFQNILQSGYIKFSVGCSCSTANGGCWIRILPSNLNGIAR